MPHTKEELIRMINVDEPEYELIVTKLTSDDIPLLVELSKDANPAIATKAISCLGMMKTETALTGVQDAAKDSNPVLRIAAAHALRNMSSKASGVQTLDKLLDDPDIGVRKFALKSVEHANIKSLKERVRTVNQRESNEHLKILSTQILQKLQ